MRIPLIFAALILCAGNFLFAQAPNISYASTPASLLINTAVGTAPNPTLTITNSGGSAVYTASTFAGSTSGTAGRANATGTSATFSNPRGITVDNSGNFYIGDKANNEIRKITSAGVVTLLAGSTTGAAGRTNATGTSALFSAPSGITTDNTNLYVADSTNNEIRKIIISSGVVSLLAGSSTGASGTTNNNTGTSARFKGPTGIAYSSSATAMYVTDYTNNEIRKVTTTGATTLLAGSSTGASGLTNGNTTTARFNHPTGIAVDATGNIYVADMGNNEIRMVTAAGAVTLFAGNASGTAGSADGTGSAASFSAPTGIAIDAAGLIYVYDSGTGLIRQITTAGVVTTVAGAGTLGYVDAGGTTAKFRGANLITDASKNIFMADAGNNTIREIIPAYTTPSLPTGLTLDPITGAVTGTPTVSTTPTSYTITAINGTGTNSATLNLNVYNKRAWTGGTSTAWLTTTNWTGSTLPSTWDQVTIGSTTAYTNLPLITTTVTVGSIIMGTSDNGTSPSITVTSPGILNVTNDISYQSDASSNTNNAFVATLSGTGTINAKNLNLLATTSLTTYTLKLTSSVTNLNLSGDIVLTGNYASGKIDNSTFTISGGIVTATDLITNNGANASSTSTLAMTSGTLNFTDPTALAGLSSNGTNTITLSSGSTIGYTASAAQTIYTSTAITGLPSGISYQGLTLSGTGIKTAASGNLNIAGNFTNSLANDVSNYLDASGATVVFNGTTQSLAGGSGTGTDFTNASFSGGGTKTIASGKINITSTGTLTLSGSSTLAAGGFLTLQSD
ncbi:MAG: SMP-30/gluconolactonase/LRE family protein, partial [Mucilaginibacter sp.]